MGDRHADRVHHRLGELHLAGVEIRVRKPEVCQKLKDMGVLVVVAHRGQRDVRRCAGIILRIQTAPVGRKAGGHQRHRHRGKMLVVGRGIVEEIAVGVEADRVVFVQGIRCRGGGIRRLDQLVRAAIVPAADFLRVIQCNRLLGGHRVRPGGNDIKVAIPRVRRIVAPLEAVSAAVVTVRSGGIGPGVLAQLPVAADAGGRDADDGRAVLTRADIGAGGEIKIRGRAAGDTEHAAEIHGRVGVRAVEVDAAARRRAVAGDRAVGDRASAVFQENAAALAVAARSRIVCNYAVFDLAVGGAFD